MNYKRARELYFINFASFITMKKNGEFEEYCKYSISKETEQKWSYEVKEKLMEDILNKNNYTHVVNLSRINLPENEILDDFRTLSLSLKKNEILQHIEKFDNLFEKDIYTKIVTIFRTNEIGWGKTEDGSKPLKK